MRAHNASFSLRDEPLGLSCKNCTEGTLRSGRDLSIAAGDGTPDRRRAPRSDDRSRSYVQGREENRCYFQEFSTRVSTPHDQEFFLAQKIGSQYLFDLLTEG